MWGVRSQNVMMFCGQLKHKHHLYYSSHLICRALFKIYFFKHLLFWLNSWAWHRAAYCSAVSWSVKLRGPTEPTDVSPDVSATSSAMSLSAGQNITWRWDLKYILSQNSADQTLISYSFWHMVVDRRALESSGKWMCCSECTPRVEKHQVSRATLAHSIPVGSHQFNTCWILCDFSLEFTKTNMWNMKRL